VTEPTDLDSSSATTAAATLIRQLGAHMASEVPALTQALRDDMSTRIAPLQGDDQLLVLLEASVRSNVESLVHLLRYDLSVANSHAPAAAREYARRLAQRDIGVAALIRAYRLGQELVTGWAFGQLDAMARDPVVALQAERLFSELTFRYIDAISEQVVEEYETERARQQTRRNTMRVAMVEELVAGRPVDVAVAEQALGHRLRQQHVAVVAWCEEGEPTAHQVANLEHAVDAVATALGGGSALFLARERVLAWAWVPVGREPGPDGATGSRPSPWPASLPPGVRVALGRAASGADGFRASHVEAQRAHRLAVAAGAHAADVTTYADSEVRAATLLAQDLEATRQLVARSLGGLGADTEGARRLRETLQTFLRLRGSYLATGEHLHLHKNTVKYRIDKAVAELGHPLDEDRLELELALVATAQLGAAVLHGP